MITLQCQIEFQSKQDKEIVLDLMRRFSSTMRYAYQRLLEGKKRKDLKKDLSKLFNINTRYSDDAIFLAQSTIASCKETGQNPKKVIFGLRKAFEQLKRKHLTGKKRKQLKKKWKESRQGNLYSRGDKSKQGNLNLRFEWIDNRLYLRINIGERQCVYTKVIRDVKREKDKWIDFMFMLENAYGYKAWFPYSVRLKVKNGKIYAFISIEEKHLHIIIKRDNGIMGIDVNTYPFHLALAFASKDGNLEKYQRINLNELLNIGSEKKNLKKLQKHLESGKNGPATRQPVNQRKQQMRNLPTSKHKSWQVLSIALAFCCLERSYRDPSPLKRVIVSRDWIAVANRLVPIPGIGAMASSKYRLSGLEMPEMAEYKYPDPNCTN